MKEALKHKLDLCITYLPIIGIFGMVASMIHFYSTFQQVSMIIAYTGFVLDVVVHAYWKQWRWTYDKWTWIGAIMLFLLVPLWWVIGIEQSPHIGHDIEVFLPFLLLGIVGLLGWGKTLKKEWLAILMLTTAIGCNIWIMAHIDVTQLFEHIHLDTNVFNAYRNSHINTHMAYGIYVNTALVLGFATLKSKVSKGVKYFVGAQMVAVVPFLWLTEGRVGFFTMILIISIMVMYYLYLWRRKWLLFLVPLLLLVDVGCMMEMVQYRKSSLLYNPRVSIWQASMDLIKEQPVLGYGSNTGHEVFVQHCVEDERVYADYLTVYIDQYGQDKIDDIHPHNIFVEQTIAFGLVGLLLLLFMCVSPVMLYKKCPIEIVMLVLVFVGQALFEKMGVNTQPCLFLLALLVLTPSTFLDHL